MKKENRDTYRIKKGVTWDEDNIELHDAERGTRMKIDEPDTPYYYYDNNSSSFSEDELQQPMINTGKIVTPEDLRLKLVECSSNLTEKLDSDSEMVKSDSFSCDSPKHTNKDDSFRSKRKIHYNEFVVAKSYRELFKDEDEQDKNQN